MGRVRIGTCSGPADAALVRSMFSAHGIAVTVGAEQHAAMLGGLGGSFVSLDIWVDEDDRDEASALLTDLRERDDRGEAPEGEADDELDDDDDASSSARYIDQRIDRRRGTGIVLLLAVCIGFGTAHMYTRAWRRGFALAALEIIGFRLLLVGNPLAPALIIGAIVTDGIGALARVRARSRTPDLPRATARRD